MSASPPTSGFQGQGTQEVRTPEGPMVKEWAGPEEWYHDGKRQGQQQPQESTTKRIDMTRRMNRTILICLGTLVMFNLVFIPAWNCIGLLRDPVYTFMVGGKSNTWLLACCILLLFVTYITLHIFLNRTRGPKMEQKLIMIACILLSTLGIILMLFSVSQVNATQRATTQFVHNCRNGPRTSSLWVASQKLQSLRAMPNCKQLDSVEDCMHYEIFPDMTEATVLKAMEDEYQCSGVCEGSTAKGEQIYPPTLFSKANFKTSCDFMAMRHLRTFGEGISKQTLWQGMCLLIAAIVMSFAQLVGLCGTGDNSEYSKHPTYGATSKNP